MKDTDTGAEGPPRQFKTVEELTVAEHLERRRSGRLPETAAYRAYRRKALERAGISEAPSPEEMDPEAMTPDDHARRKYGG